MAAPRLRQVLEGGCASQLLHLLASPRWSLGGTGGEGASHRALPQPVLPLHQHGQTPRRPGKRVPLPGLWLQKQQEQQGRHPLRLEAPGSQYSPPGARLCSRQRSREHYHYPYRQCHGYRVAGARQQHVPGRGLRWASVPGWPRHLGAWGGRRAGSQDSQRRCSLSCVPHRAPALAHAHARTRAHAHTRARAPAHLLGPRTQAAHPPTPTPTPTPTPPQGAQLLGATVCTTAPPCAHRML